MNLVKVANKAIVDLDSVGNIHIIGELVDDTWVVKCFLQNTNMANALIEFIKDKKHDITLVKGSAKTALKVLTVNDIKFNLVENDYAPEMWTWQRELRQIKKY